MSLEPVDPSLLQELESLVPGGVRARSSDRLAMAHDASHYLLIPQVVVSPQDTQQMAALLSASARLSLPLTFRSGGTSLSGQAVSRGVLVDSRRHFRDIEVLDEGLRVRVQPGATVRQVNARLSPYGRKLGPDPASESACTIGGVVANNSSGMACGTELNTYRTLESMVLVLASGTVVDTGAPDADARLHALERDLYEGLLRLRDRVRANPESMRIIEQQFSMKNTMGYGLNSLVDHSSPTQMLGHLVIGSEGTLAFVAEATFRSVPLKGHAATGLLVFDNLRGANDALPALIASGPATVELLDAASLRVAQTDPHADSVLRDLTVSRHAALLVEFQELSADELDERVATAAPLLEQLAVSQPALLSKDARTRAGLWHMRKGLYAAVAGARPSGTTAMLEDIAVPVPSLGATCEELINLFSRHGYEETVIFGHAKDGNIHFLLSERLASAEQLARYVAFTEDLVGLVLGKHGTLKAEHGTGRIMAPFVRRQYGDELHAVMVELKQLCDPGGVLNPGVLLTGDPRAHVQDLKVTPTVEAEVDRCVECGYCEPACPSRDLTLTPRQRIVLRREMAQAMAAGDTGLLAELEGDFAYDGLETCAADGMCQTACPVLIDTGSLVKRLRAEQMGRVENAAWATAAKHWGAATRAASASLSVAKTLPAPLVAGASRAGRAALGTDRVPQWSADLPRGGRPRLPRAEPSAVAVVFPSCTGSIFGPVEGGVTQALFNLCDRAGVAVEVPAEIGSLCCGTPWTSKGLTAGLEQMRSRVLQPLLAATRQGELPLVCDASSCSEGLRQLLAAEPRIQVVDAIDFVHAQVLPRLPIPRRLASLALHPTCSTARAGGTDVLVEVAQAVADEVVIPEGWGCCAFAGDRGLLHPELTASATAAEAAAVGSRDFAAHASSNRTCEIGMTRATGESYVHLLELLDAATSPVRG